MSNDRSRLIRGFDRLAAQYAEHAEIPREIGRRLIEHLDAIRLSPTLILDLGSGPGEGAALLGERYPASQVIALDISQKMLLETPESRSIAPVCAHVGALPFQAACCDLLYSNLMFPCCTDRPALLTELRRVTKSGGLILFSTLGPGSFSELRQCTSQPKEDSEPYLADLHDVGDELIRTGWRDPVMETEWLSISYSYPQALLKELKQLGGALLRPRHRSLAGRHRMKQLISALEAFRVDGRITVRLEVIYGHAWAVADHRENFEGAGERPAVHPLRRRRIS